MNTTNKPARFFLVQKLSISNQEALTYFTEKRLLVNGRPALINQPISISDRVELDGKVLQEPKEFVYLCYHKPRGIETTLNKDIPANLTTSIDLPEGVYPIGRLDKESEGLLLLTNDGNLYKSIANSKKFQEKEYLVTVDKSLSEDAICQLSSGITIMGQMTRPAKVSQTGPYSFKIVLTQGLNRQIRRMCYKLGYEVTMLKRIRIVNIYLGELCSGQIRQLNKVELDSLKISVGCL